MTKPTNLAEWGTGAAPIVEPSTPQKQAGFAVSDRPPAQWFNWFFNLVHLWIVWLDAFESTIHTWSAFQTFSAFENTTTAIFNGSADFNDAFNLNTGGSASIARELNFFLAAVDSPMFTRSNVATAPNLIFRQDVTVGGIIMRLYSQVDRGLMVTYNARWDVGGSNWVKDAAGNAWMMSLGKGVRHYQAPGSTPFVDAAWVEVFNTWREGDGQAGLAVGSVWYGRAANDGVVEAGRYIPQLAWTNLALQANLTAVVGDEPQYYRDSTGRVWLRGVAVSNTTIVSGSQIATQPITAVIERPMTVPQVLVGATPNMQLVFQSSNRIDLQVGSPGNIGAGVAINFANLSYRAL